MMINLILNNNKKNNYWINYLKVFLDNKKWIINILIEESILNLFHILILLNNHKNINKHNMIDF